MSCYTDRKIVFGLSFIVWVSISTIDSSFEAALIRSTQLAWFTCATTVLWQASNSNLLAAGEFSWGFGTVFSALGELGPLIQPSRAVSDAEGDMLTRGVTTQWCSFQSQASYARSGLKDDGQWDASEFRRIESQTAARVIRQLSGCHK